MHVKTPYQVNYRFITQHFFPVASTVIRHKVGGYLEQQKLSFEQDEEF